MPRSLSAHASSDACWSCMKGPWMLTMVKGDYLGRARRMALAIFPSLGSPGINMYNELRVQVVVITFHGALVETELAWQ